MDYWGEAIALTVDAIIFGLCCKVYYKFQQDIIRIQDASSHGVNPNIQAVLFKNKKKYIVVQGDVKALGKPIKSINYPEVTGVIQKLSVTEHAIARNASGFWADQKHTIQEAHNVVPFILKRGDYQVEILDPLSASVLDLDTIADRFESSSLSFMDHIVGFFSGVRQRGLQTTEEMLKEGTVITGIGEISLSPEGKAQLFPPSDGSSYYLTVMPVSSLLRKLDESKLLLRRLTLLFGGVGLVLGALVLRRWWLNHLRKKQEEALRKRLEETRRARRQIVRDSEIPENQRCVVCQTNPREIIVLPCGHVCMCEDCNDSITNECPVCRTHILQRAAAYIS